MTPSKRSKRRSISQKSEGEFLSHTGSPPQHPSPSDSSTEAFWLLVRIIRDFVKRHDETFVTLPKQGKCLITAEGVNYRHQSDRNWGVLPFSLCHISDLRYIVDNMEGVNQTEIDLNYNIPPSPDLPKFKAMDD